MTYIRKFWGCHHAEDASRTALFWCDIVLRKPYPRIDGSYPDVHAIETKKTNAEHVFSRCVSLKLVPPTEKHGTRVSPHFGENDHCTTTLVWSNLDCVSWGWGVPFKFSEAPKTTKQNAQHNHDLRAPQISGTQHIHTYSFYDLNTCINNSKLPHVPTQYYHAFGKLLRALPMPNKKIGNLDTPEPAPNRSKDRKRKTCFTHRNFSSSSPSSVGKTACRSAFLFGGETWGGDKRQEVILDVAYWQEPKGCELL